MAVLVRKIDREHPTLLLDESDAAFKGPKEYAEALRGILNSGYRRGGRASLCVVKNREITYRDFECFCPKAIAGIGALPDTVADRSIPIRLKRKARHEKVERFLRREVEPEARQLCREIESWARQWVPRLRTARPELPDELSDRQQDVGEPLLTIADAIGGEWPERARRALVEVCCGQGTEDQSLGVKLLADIRQVFDSCRMDRISSEDLCVELARVETSPWAEWYGKAITKMRLAHLLKPYEIRPESVRIGDKTPKGYMRKWFEDSWSRYLGTSPPSLCYASPKGATSATSLIPNEIEKKGDATSALPVAPSSDPKSREIRQVAGVAPSGRPTETARGLTEGEL
mgnify:CR=1 FL=1